MGAFSVWLSARVVGWLGLRRALWIGFVLVAAGLALFARAPLDARYAVDVLPAMLLLGFGAGIAFNPLLLAAMSDAAPSESGLASGAVNTSFMLGGALGLAILASFAAARTGGALVRGIGETAALNAGYHVAFAIGALFAVIAALFAAVRLRPGAATDTRRDPATAFD